MSARTASRVVLLVAICLRAVHVLTIRDYPLFDVLSLDAESYDRWARLILGGHWMRGAPFYQAPLYAYFLAGLHLFTGGDLLVPRLANVLMGAGTVALVMRIGRRTFGTWVGVIAGALCAVHGTFLFEEGKVMKTSLGVLLIAAFLATLLEARLASRHRPVWALAAGLLGGAAALVRENFLLVMIVAVIWKLWRREGRVALALALGIAAAVLPATLHNAAYDGEFLPITSQAGQNFYTGVHPGNPHGGYLVPDFVRRSPRFEETDFRDEAQRRTGRAMTPGEVSSYWLRQGLKVAADDPVRFARLFVTKLGLLYHRHEIPDDEDIRFFRRYAPVLRLPLVGFGPIAVLGLLGLALAVRRRTLPGELALLVVVYTVSVALFFVFSRYRLPLVLPLAVLAGYALREAAAAVRAKAWRGVALGAAVAGAFALVVFRPLDVPAQFENSYLSVGIALEVKGEPERAWAEYRKGLELTPDHPKLLRRGALLLFERDTGRGSVPTAETLSLLHRAVAANPHDVALRSRYGAGLAVTGQPGGAVEQFRMILSDGEEPPGIHFNLALALEDLGRVDSARAEAALALARTPEDPAVRQLASRLGVR